MDTLPHISEEAAAVSKAKGEDGPDIEAQGTPVQEVSINVLLVFWAAENWISNLRLQCSPARRYSYIIYSYSSREFD